MSVHERQFKQWHDQYQPRLLSSITALVRDQPTAEDITATALATAWGKRDQFRHESSLDTWIYRIALNEAYDAKSRKRGVSLDAQEGAQFVALAEPGHFAEELERSERCHRLQQALRQLPAMYRQVLMDHFVRGCSVKQVAQKRRVPFGTVLSRISTAKRLLRTAWDHADRNAGR